MEIERKFLIKSLPSLNKVRYIDIQQGYLSANPEVRIRKTTSFLNDHYYLTVKSAGLIAREEFEIEISAATYRELIDKVTKSLHKTRYFIPLDGELIAELDIYPDGLQTVEVEFPSVEKANEFIPPDWFGPEVTGRAEFKNKNLAKSLP